MTTSTAPVTVMQVNKEHAQKSHNDRLTRAFVHKPVLDTMGFKVINLGRRLLTC